MTQIAEKKILDKLEQIEILLKFFLDQTEELTEEEKKLVLQGQKQIEKGDYVEWPSVARTL